MNIIEEKNGVVYFEKEPILESLPFLIDDVFVSINEEDYLLYELIGVIPEYLGGNLKKELSDIENINFKIPVEKHIYSFSERYKDINSFMDYLKDNSVYLSIENIFVLRRCCEGEEAFYLSPSVKMKFIFSLLLAKTVKNKLKSFKEINKAEKDIGKAISAKEKKQKELSGCEDIAFVNKKISFYDKKIDKLNKEKNKILNEKKLMFDSVNSFVESKGLSDIYEYIYKNINFVED